MNDNKNCYLILHLSTSATREEVKKSYRKLANLYHPDKPTGDAERFRIIKDAYDKLMKATPATKAAPNTNHNTREMPEPEFIFMGATEKNGAYKIEVLLLNVLKIRANGDNNWDIPHNTAYSKSIQAINLNLSHEDAKRINYHICFTITGTNGQEYETRTYGIPKPKSRLEKLFNNIW